MGQGLQAMTGSICLCPFWSTGWRFSLGHPCFFTARKNHYTITRGQHDRVALLECASKRLNWSPLCHLKSLLFGLSCHYLRPKFCPEKSLNGDVGKLQLLNTARATPILKHPFRWARLQFVIGQFHGDSPDVRCGVVMLMHASMQVTGHPCSGANKTNIRMQHANV